MEDDQYFATKNIIAVEDTSFGESALTTDQDNNMSSGDELHSENKVKHSTKLGKRSKKQYDNALFEVATHKR